MRPIDRGTAPRTYARYQDAFADLAGRLGEYCSYCERKIPVSLAVEHIQPKSLEPALINAWENFLLACANCNSVKGHVPVAVADYLWPDLDNTHLAFDYLRVPGTVFPAGADIAKSLATLDLTGLDRVPDHPNPAKRITHTDRRWQHRLEAFESATRYRALLQVQDSEEVRGLIVDLAKAIGFFSLWVSIFAGDADMVHRFVAAFPGSAATAFAADGTLVSR